MEQLCLTLEKDLVEFIKKRPRTAYCDTILEILLKVGLLDFHTFEGLSSLTEEVLCDYIRKTMGDHLDNQLGEIGWGELKQVLYEVRTSATIRSTFHRGIGPLLPDNSPKARPYRPTHHFVNATLLADTTEVMHMEQLANPVPPYSPFPGADTAGSSYEDPLINTGSTPPDSPPETPLEKSRTQYIPRAKYLRLVGEGVHTAKQPSALTTPTKTLSKKGRSSLIPINDPRVDPIRVALHFKEASSTLAACAQAGYSEDVLRDFINRRFSYRCSKTATLLKYTRFMVEFIEFAGSLDPLPLHGATVP